MSVLITGIDNFKDLTFALIAKEDESFVFTINKLAYAPYYQIISATDYISNRFQTATFEHIFILIRLLNKSFEILNRFGDYTLNTISNQLERANY